MRGLIIKEKWLDLIISGDKTLEIRGHNTTCIGEEIYLLESTTHRVRGIAIIEDTLKLNCDDWSNYENEHKVHLPYKDAKIRYRNVWAWRIKVKEVFTTPKTYKHKKGAIIWLKDVEIVEND